MRQADRGVDLVYSSVVSGERTRLGEGCLAQIAPERAHVVVTPVVNYETGALGEDLVASAVLADEVCDDAIVLGAEQLHLFIRARGHGLESRVGLPTGHVAACGESVGVGHLTQGQAHRVWTHWLYLADARRLHETGQEVLGLPLMLKVLVLTEI